MKPSTALRFGATYSAPLHLLTSLLAIVSTLPSQVGAAAQSIEDVFAIQRGSGTGGCDRRRPLLDSIHFPEAQALTQAALSAITNHRTSRPARDHLAAFFGVQFKSEAEGYAPVDAAHLDRVTCKWKRFLARIPSRPLRRLYPFTYRL